MKRLYPKQPLVGIGAVMVCSNKILLEKRKNEPGKGKWSIPGGIVELGEKAEQTAIREVREETNLTVEKPELIDVVDNVELDENGKVKYHFVIIDYFVRLKGGRLKASSDAAELKWVNLDNVENYVLTRTFREFFIRNREKLEKFDSCKPPTKLQGLD
ncbi:MAG TPA: NUDIX hydrolase [candidate division Zixibacteria bacterium]|nr:NUDIX hydrolase [candidate division Zixibacteria bacterium]